MGLRLVDKQGQQSQKMVIFGAIFLLMTLLILYSSNSGNDISPLYSPFRASTPHHAIKVTNLKKWAGKEGYVAVYGNKNMTLHCHHCALVTSSSHVLGSGAGPEIDHTQCVIRMNDAPTTGFERDVGNRTTLRVVAHSSVFRVVRRPTEFLNHTDHNSAVIFWGPPTKIGREAKGTLYRLIQRVSMTYSNLSSFTITPSKMHKFDTLFQKETGRDRAKSQSWLSTGWFTMVIAIEMCDNIKVYGMVPPSHCGSMAKTFGSKRCTVKQRGEHSTVCGKKPQPKKMPYHYYKPRGSEECVTYLQNEKGRKGPHHRFITEKQVFAHWAKQYNISFTRPTW
ncbi:alpha-N-acetylgalactosaminide alpha-2,6-sialyltransferase 6-like [Oncorhynchus keta]|uniref:alpha-N-acetylgalactosaminide alpha-2,6-sialyltransferase 6-like n=1 Tax=Oncorhynchus keta TaxID=8018 RepID=UPI00227C4B25|nr:alpha-N-acetylgalactosaminide alpha-2,6-sialyltransferase 6-like [Oncorhynchus keta]XP_052377596.1 alpha-N-acetylgalactosaminide alpha-2,6-sialyltransferase 6-like [Oncorhynchus keta]XP_052377597.1 alpha-N-acetylgalactosaminide alpha-2,6-sialyltransferase 6-like [Oncorhynchus keta]